MSVYFELLWNTAFLERMANNYAIYMEYFTTAVTRLT